MKVIAIDPGVTTGYCYARVMEEVLYYYPFQIMDDVDDLFKRLHSFGPRYIIMEDFQFRQGKQRTGINLFPVQLIGVAKLYSIITVQQCALELQSPYEGKGYYNDAVLKRKGLYKRGIPHAMDASRHLLHFFAYKAGYQYNIQQAVILESWTD